MENVKKQKLVDKVLSLIVEDVNYGDLTSVEELIKSCPFDNLLNYVPEEEQEEYL